METRCTNPKYLLFIKALEAIVGLVKGKEGIINVSAYDSGFVNIFIFAEGVDIDYANLIQTYSKLQPLYDDISFLSLKVIKNGMQYSCTAKCPIVNYKMSCETADGLDPKISITYKCGFDSKQMEKGPIHKIERTFLKKYPGIHFINFEDV